MKLRDWIDIFELGSLDILRVNHPEHEFDGPVFDVVNTKFADMECDEFVYIGSWPTPGGLRNRYRVDVGW